MSSIQRAILTIAFAFLTSSVSSAGDPAANLGFRVPKGFEVTLYADDALATDIHAMTIDARGRVVVASKGYIKILHENAKGTAGKATLFADFPKSGAHGMVFDGNDLICVGDNGVRRLYDTEGVGKCDKVSPVWFATKNDGDHAANGIHRGPDGWYYLVAGNDAGITMDHANGPASPVKAPNAGAIVRFSPDGKTREVIAHGFRNPYDLAFGHLGNLFTVDADGERVHQMPYYAPTRVFDVAQGMHHGWLLPGWVRGWSRPPVWPDSTPRMVEIGRGSPTGVAVYRHRNFPERYRNGVFSLCWTFGRVYFFPTTPSGSTFDSKKEIFMETTGDVGFAPTAMTVGRNGELFIAIGGRGTRGSVFRVRYVALPPIPYVDPLQKVLAADQPLSSWSRAAWVPLAKELGKEAFVKAAVDVNRDMDERIRAIEVLTELFGGVPVDVAAKVTHGNAPPDLVARAIWSVSRTNTGAEARIFMCEMTRVQNPRVARAAWEALLALPDALDPREVNPHWNAGLTSGDRRVRAATILAAKGAGRASFVNAYANPRRVFPSEQLASLWVAPPAADVQFAFCRGFILDKKLDPWLRLEAVRLLQIALGDVNTDDGPEKAFVGYVARHPDKLAPAARRQAARELAEAFPTGDAPLDMELARLLGMLSEDAPGLLDRIADRWTVKSRPEDDIHYLLALSRLPGKRSPIVTQQTAAALNGIQVKLAARGVAPSDQVPGILEALLERLMSHDPALPAALVANADFGRPGHAIYANHLPLKEKQAAARKLVAGIAKLDEDAARAAWSPDLVRVVSALPDAEALPVLREKFTDPRLSDTITLVLAAKNLPEDRGRWIDALSSPQPGVVEASASALLSLPKEKPEPAEIGKVVRALRRLDGQKVDAKIPQTLLALWNAGPESASPWTRPRPASPTAGSNGTRRRTRKRPHPCQDWRVPTSRPGRNVSTRSTGTPAMPRRAKSSSRKRAVSAATAKRGDSAPTSQASPSAFRATISSPPSSILARTSSPPTRRPHSSPSPAKPTTAWSSIPRPT
jgi:glucose/arabinose dehydrogenase